MTQKGFKDCRVQGVEKICSVPIYWGRIKENFVGSKCRRYLNPLTLGLLFLGERCRVRSPERTGAVNC